MSQGTPSGPEIQLAVRDFAARWANYAGTERAEAQTFLTELFACYGTDHVASDARFEDVTTSAGFLDLHWAGVRFVETKAPSRAGHWTAERSSVFASLSGGSRG
jgi:hypothetical protein